MMLRSFARFGAVLLFFLTACGVAPTPSLDPTPAGMEAGQAAVPVAAAATETINVTSTTAVTATTPATAPAASATPIPEISPAASAYLEAALEIMQNYGIYRHQVNWEKMRDSTFQKAGPAQTPTETYHAIRYALLKAGGRHSFFVPPVEVEQLEQLTMDDSPAPRGKLLLGDLGFVAIEGFGSIDLEEGARYATLVQQLIRDLDSQGACGWVVDLRENTGGNMWPMLAGLGPILGEGKAGSFVDPDGLAVDWSYQDGQALLDGNVAMQVNGPAYQLKAAEPPVALLTGGTTASSGEAIVVSFRQRPHTRSFGSPTNGVSTANQGFPLGDGAWIYLTTAVFADRTGQAYGDQIIPDETIVDGQNFTLIEGESIPQPAIDWLMTQPACADQ